MQAQVNKILMQPPVINRFFPKNALTYRPLPSTYSGTLEEIAQDQHGSKPLWSGAEPAVLPGALFPIRIIDLSGGPLPVRGNQNPFFPKGADVRTTIDEQVGRRGGAYSVEELESTLNQARKLLADTMALLELENERFFKTEFDQDDKAHLDTVMDLIKRVQKAMQTVIDMELKYGLAPFDARQQLDLEAARAEILERFRRLPRKAA